MQCFICRRHASWCFAPLHSACATSSKFGHEFSHNSGVQYVPVLHIFDVSVMAKRAKGRVAESAKDAEVR